MRYPLLAVLFLSLFGASTAAKADSFTVTSPGTTFTFSLPSSPTPSQFVNGVAFALQNVDVSVNGVSQAESVAFGPTSFGIGDSVFVLPFGYGIDGALLFADTPLVYSGTEQNPTFLPGTYLGSVEGTDVPETLLIEGGNPASTPEPSSLALLGTGVLGAFGMVRRKFSAA